jgi:hypothetical protein
MKLQTGSRFFQAKRLRKITEKLPKSLPIIPVIIGFSCLLLLFSGTIYYANSANRSKSTASTPTGKEQLTTNAQKGSELSQASGATGSTNNNVGNSPTGGSTPKPSGSASSSKPYTPYNCVKTVLPYKTNYKLASYLGSGSTNVIGGKDGYTSVCTADSNGLKPNDANIQPVDRTIYVGDGGGSLSVSPHPQSEPYDVVYARAIPSCDELASITNNDPTARQWCINNVVAGILHYYGY